MFYYIGPWNIVDGKYEPPKGTVSLIDLRSLPSMVDGDGFGLFASDIELDSNYALLSNIDMQYERAHVRHLNIIESLLGYRPDGDMVSDLMADFMMNGSDPDGLDAMLPIMPGHGKLECSINGSVFERRRFRFDGPEFNKVQHVMKNQYRAAREEGTDAHRRLLGMWAKEYNIKNPEDYFTPTGMKKERPILPRTVYVETWPSNGTTLTSGQDQTWSDNIGEVVSNEWNQTSTAEAQANTTNTTALSADNIWTDLDIIQLDPPTSGPSSAGASVQINARSNSGATTYYRLEIFNTRGSNQRFRISKFAPVETIIKGLTDITGNLLGVKRLEVVGSQVYFYNEGVQEWTQTDTSIVTGKYGGFGWSNDDSQAANTIKVDDVRVGDEQFLSLNPLGVNKYLPLEGYGKFSVWRVI